MLSIPGACVRMPSVNRLRGRSHPQITSLLAIGLGGAITALCAGCGAIYPEIATSLRTVPEAKKLNPEPPEDVVYLGFDSANIPDRTRDGRKWDRGGNAPDPYAILLVNGEELIRTPVQSDTLSPSWPDQLRNNYRIKADAEVVVELWDDNALSPTSICHQVVQGLTNAAAEGQRSVSCDSGARVTLGVAPAKARWGLGLFYELRTSSVYVTRVIAESPAGRLRLQGGDEILAIMGRPVSRMAQGEVQSLINANAASGVVLRIKQGNGNTVEVSLREGPVYPIKGEGVSLD